MEKNPVITIVMATMLEAKPFIESIPLEQVEKKPFSLYKNKNMFLILSGIGKANAAMATAYACRKLKPGRIFNLGAAGATDFTCSLGEIFHVVKIFEFDRPEFKSGKPHIHIPSIINGFKTANLATSDKAILDPEERKKISEIADLVDMEGASVVQACRIFQTECLMFKFVSDVPDHTRDSDIVENIRLYRKKFSEFFLNRFS
ncbi:MAG: 5'-methylthioadenosine/S-adenosylhomocysteine nucleosidase [Deltaproteobacteria bacterium]|nr:5'-methylthioadenosine/S-adenosylhomocysteine nucleosidase [Deltaproteobacteria bacterium]